MPDEHWENLKEIFSAAVALNRLKEEVLLDNLHSDPRYVDLLRRVGLPQ